MSVGAFLVKEDNHQGFKERVRRLVKFSSHPHLQEQTTFALPKWISLGLALLFLGLTVSHPRVLETVHTVIERAVHLLN
jgi:hypothetical protein